MNRCCDESCKHLREVIKKLSKCDEKYMMNKARHNVPK